MPAHRPDHCAAITRLALDMRDVLARYTDGRGLPLEARFGIHCGPVIGGVIGMRLPRYRMFGDTVSI